MSSDMRDMRATARQAAIEDARRRFADPRPRQRLDGALLVIGAALIAVAAAGSYAAASWIVASGRLDPPLVTEVQDRRILTDYRDNASPMRDMVAVGDDLLVGRKDGSVDRFDMAGRTFAAESLPRSARFSGDLALLSADCPAAGCPEGASVYAVTAQGGLAERRDGTWQVRLGDGAFRAADGTPVEQADVAGWAVSDDGRFVLVNAASKGLGLFDQRSGVWRRRAAIADAGQGPLFHAGAFWLGARDGLHRLPPDQPGFDAASTLVADTEGEILALADSVSDGLLALRRSACADGQGGCLSLLGIDAEGGVAVLHAELQVDPNLNDSGLRHVALQGEDLVTLGTAGVHVYASAARRWTTLAAQEPTAHFAETDGRRLLVGLPDSFLVISDGEVARRTTLEAPLRQILPGAGAEVFGLDDRGRVLKLDGETAQVLAQADPGAPPDARFTRAAAVGSLFVALGPDGILVHDSAARRYSFTPAAALPPLPVSDALLVPGQGRLWIVSQRSGDVRSLKIAGDFPAKQLSVESHGSAARAVARARADGAGLTLVAADGTLLQLASPEAQIVPQVGPGLPEGLRPVSMAASGAAYFFASKDRLWLYNQDQRGWLGPMAAPEGGAGLADIAIAGDRLLGLDRNGTVYSSAEDGWRQVYGGPVRARFGAAAVQDVMASGRRLFLASDSVVQSYTPGERRFGASWTAPGRDAEILDVANDVPLWKNSGGIHAGDKPIFGGDRFIDGWLGAHGAVAMAERNGRRYVSSGQSCLYMGVAAPRGDVRDVVPIDRGRLLVRTATEAGIYQPDLHRWLRVEGLGAGGDGRLLNLGGHLVRLAPNGIFSVPVAAIQDVPSCAAAPVGIDWQVSLTGRQASQVDGAPEALVLMGDGSLRRWAGGQVAEVAPAAGDGPAMSGPAKVYAAAGGGLHVLMPDALWRYDLSARTWSRQAFAGAPREVTQFDLAPGSNPALISLWDGDGALWQGQSAAGDTIAFARAARPVLPVIPIAPAEIRDMARFGSSIAVLSDRRLLIYESGSEAPRADIALPAPDVGWQLASDSSGDLILMDGAITAPVAIHRLDGSVAGKAGLAVLSARYLPGTDRTYSYSSTALETELFRIDQDLNAWRCSLVRGQATPDCQLLAGPPMRIEASDVRGFLRAANLMLTRDALWLLDEAKRPLGRVQGPAPGTETVLFSSGGVPMLWEGPGRALWRIEGSKAIRVLDNVDFLHRTDRSYAALVGDEVKGIADGQLLQPLKPDSSRDDPAMHAHYTLRGHVVLSKAGIASAEQGGLRSDPLIRFAADLVTVLPVPGDGQDPQRWLQEIRGGRLNLIWADRCEVPAPRPAPLPADFIGPPAPVVQLPPVIRPCVKAQDLPGRLDAGEHVIALSEAQAGGLSVLTNRRSLLFSPAGALAEAVAATPLVNDSQGQDELRGALAQIDGRSYLNPPRISVAEMTGLRNRISLAPLTPAVLEAFDEGWIGWQRPGRRVRLATSSEPIEMAPDEAIRDGRFLPAHPARGLALAGGRIAWLNAFGLWHQSAEGLRRVSDQGMALPQAAYQGVFLDSARGLVAADGTVTAAAGPRTLRIDALEFTIDPRQQQVAATIAVAGGKAPALAARGFLHDQRQSAAQVNGAVTYLTPVGLIPQAQLAGAQSLPMGAQRLEAEHGRLLLRTGAGWLQQDGQGQWQGASEPFRDGRLASENGRIWDRKDGLVVLRPARPGEDWRLARQGLDFDIDQLQAFAATPQLAVAITRAGTHVAPALADLAGVAAPVGPAPGAGELDTIRSAPAQRVLFHRDATGYRIWDQQQSQWRLPKADERHWETRALASVEDISAGYRGKAWFEIAVDVIGQQSPARLPFTWNAGEVMPFDEVTAIHGDPGDPALLVGTRLGLRRLTSQADGYANQRLIVPGDRATGLAVRAVGRPAASPDRIVAEFASGCAAFTAITATPTACNDASGLATKFVARTGYWRWSKSDGAVQGDYLLEGGAQLPLRPPLQGRLPHDNLADGMTCGSLRAELWRDAEVLRLAGKQVQVAGAQELFCQPASVPLDGTARLEAGLYVLTSAGVLRADAATMAAVGPIQAAAIRDRASGRVVLETGRLRYGINGDEVTVHRLDLAGQWRPTGWAAGRLLLDQPRFLAWHDRGLQLVTDAGVFDAPPGHLDPARLVVMSGADDDALATCAASRVEILDGRAHGLPAEAGRPLRLSCRDGSWLQGAADNSKDLGAFAATAGAARARILVDAPPLWQVEQDLDAQGDVQATRITFQGEPARLAAGRFDFDAFRAIAAPFSGLTELLTETGWWRAPAGVPRLSETRRVQSGQLAFRDVRAMTRDRSQRSDALGLCLALPGGKALWWDGAAGVEATAHCREVRGRDPLWRWWRQEDAALATAQAAGGRLLERRIVSGRFEDLIVRGAPLRDPQGRLLAAGGLGVLVLDSETAQPVAIHSASDDVLLTRALDGRVVQLGRQGAHYVEDAPAPAPADGLACPALAGLAAALPEGYRIARGDMLPDNRVSAMVEGGEASRQVLLQCEDPAPGRAWTAVVDISSHPRALAAGPAQAGMLAVAMTGTQISLDDGRNSAAADFPVARLQGMVPRPDGGEIFLLGDDRLLSISVSAAIGALHGGVAAVPPARSVPASPPAAAPSPALTPSAADPPLVSQRPTVARRSPTRDTAPGRPMPSAISAQFEPKYDPVALQLALRRELGVDLGADGVIGPASRRAIAAWQSRIGSKPTGFLSVAQWYRLKGEGE